MLGLVLHPDFGMCTLAVYLFVCLCQFAKLLLMLSIPIFFCIFADGTIQSPSASLWLWYC